MKRFAQIIDNKVFYIYVEEQRPPFPDDVLLIDVTDQPEVEQGWTYDPTTGEFKELIVEIPEVNPVEPRPSLEEMQAQTLLNTEYLVSLKDLGI